MLCLLDMTLAVLQTSYSVNYRSSLKLVIMAWSDMIQFQVLHVNGIPLGISYFVNTTSWADSLVAIHLSSPTCTPTMSSSTKVRLFRSLHHCLLSQFAYTTSSMFTLPPPKHPASSPITLRAGSRDLPLPFAPISFIPLDLPAKLCAKLPWADARLHHLSERKYLVD